MPSLNLDTNYFSHQKTVRLVGLLGKGSEVLPIKLWCYCGSHHAEDGRLDGYSAEEIENAIGWWGKSGEAVKALVKVGFLDAEGSALVVHEWDDHEGHIKAFHRRAKVAAKARWKKADDATSMLEASLEQCSTQTKPTNNTGGAGEEGGRTPEERDLNIKLSEAESYARCWITAECSTYLKPMHISALARLIVRVGRESATSQVRPFLFKKDIPKPFAYLEGKLDRMQQDRQHNAHPARKPITAVKVYE